ncbi:hypothetical protein BV898_10837 [Hypsibius exemplaris]|uniref:RING-type E3 ubiquitin transferase n=1 Tax=Hypsibius exemplaris TaxID=2072580 RepID=A0A1W0WIC0_HYPEX|nr:hypothetical protein BV898_10837 [Hypsibius exemplaris]
MSFLPVSTREVLLEKCNSFDSICDKLLNRLVWTGKMHRVASYDGRAVQGARPIRLVFGRGHYFIGPAWDLNPWPTFSSREDDGTTTPPKTASPLSASSSGTNTDSLFLTMAISIGSRLLLSAGAFVCWFVIKFWPSSQMILLAVWMEALCMFAVCLALSITSIHASLPTAVGLTIIISLLHSFMLTNLRQLRILELMGLPVSVLDESFRTSSGIGEGFTAYFWPKLSLMAVAIRSVHELTDNLRYGMAVVLLLTSLPTLWLVVDGLRWRAFGARHVLSARSNGEVRLSVVSPYYQTFDAFIWPSVNEDMVNKAYAMVWLGQVFYGLGLAAYRAETFSPAVLWQVLPSVLIQTTTTSWVSNFGACWFVAAVYHRILSLWTGYLGVTFTSAAEERQYGLMKYDMAGFLAALSFMGNIMAPDAGLTVTHLTRIGIFFCLAKLDVMPTYAGNCAQRAAMDGIVTFKGYTRAIFDGSLVPVGIGWYALSRLWKAPLQFDQLLSGTWLSDREVLFATDFEIWLHGEAIFFAVDVCLAAGHTIINTVASHAHLVAHQSPRFWHAVLQKTDLTQKFWTRIVREVLSVVINSLVLSLLWKNRLDGVIVTAIYMSRLMNNLETLHTVSTEGIPAQFFCWSRCIVRALKSPTEEAFAAWNDKCSICQLEEPQRTELAVFPCSHFFHRECIEEWLKLRMVCPLCMQNIRFVNGEVKIDK